MQSSFSRKSKERQDWRGFYASGRAKKHCKVKCKKVNEYNISQECLYDLGINNFSDWTGWWPAVTSFSVNKWRLELFSIKLFIGKVRSPDVNARFIGLTRFWAGRGANPRIDIFGKIHSLLVLFFFFSNTSATSDGTDVSLTSQSGGHCTTHNMKVTFYVCLSDQGSYTTVSRAWCCAASEANRSY